MGCSSNSDHTPRKGQDKSQRRPSEHLVPAFLRGDDSTIPAKRAGFESTSLSNRGILESSWAIAHITQVPLGIRVNLLYYYWIWIIGISSCFPSFEHFLRRANEWRRNQQGSGNPQIRHLVLVSSQVACVPLSRENLKPCMTFVKFMVFSPFLV